MKPITFFLAITFLGLLPLFTACTSYGAGGVYNSAVQGEWGGYVFADAEFAEATANYTVNRSDTAVQSFGAGVSLKYPVPLGKLTLFPLANIEYQRILGATEAVKNLGWLRFGGGLDFSFTDAFYLRAEGMYAPDLFSLLSEPEMLRLNPAAGYSIRAGLGWKPGAAKSSKPSKPAPSKTSYSSTPAKPAEDTMVNIYDGARYYWPTFNPAVPKDVPSNIYKKLWDINLKTIKAGKYDFNAFNYNTAQWITYNESAMSDNYTFAGVCANYADYFIFVLKHDPALLELFNKGVITVNNSPTHRWVEYHTAQNRYIIDPTWCDWDYVGEPQGMYAGKALLAEACRTAPNRNTLIEAKAKSWFFRNVRTVTEANDRRAHGL